MERPLAAILAADVVGLSRLVEADDEGTLSSLQAVRAGHIDPAIAANRGRIGRHLHCRQRLRAGPQTIDRQLKGRAELALGEDEDARESLEGRVALNPNSAMARAFLTAIKGPTARGEEARANLAVPHKINPTFPVAAFQTNYPYTPPTRMDRLADGLGRAGFVG